MPQVAPDYEENIEIINIADRLITLYPEMFGGIDVSKIAAFSITNKDKGEGKPIWNLIPIKPPTSILCNKDYVITVFLSSYEQLNDNQKAAMVSDVLCSIPPEGKGQTVPKDIKEHGIMLRTLGVDFMEKEDLPDILSGNVEWVRN